MGERTRYFRDGTGRCHRVTDEIIDEADVPADQVAPFEDQAPAPPEDVHLVIRWPWESDTPVEHSKLTQAICAAIGLMAGLAILWFLHGTIFSPF